MPGPPSCNHGMRVGSERLGHNQIAALEDWGKTYCKLTGIAREGYHH